MGTRSIIVVTGPTRLGFKKSPSDFRTYRLYKHYDGYPTSNLAIINGSIQQAQSLKLENGLISAATLTGLLIGGATDQYGMSAQLEHESQNPMEDSDLGDQWDLEWIYIIDTEHQTVNVYGGSYKECSPQDHIKQGPIDPETFVDSLRDECKESHRNEIKSAVRAISAWSFKVNPQTNVIKIKSPKKSKTQAEV